MKFWESISNIGLKESTSSVLKRKVQLTNRMIFTLIVVELGYLPLYLSLNLSVLFYINIFLLLIFTSLLFILTKKGKHAIAAFLLSILLILDITFLSFVTSGNNSLLYLIPFSVFGFALTDNTKISIAIFISSFLAFFLAGYLRTIMEPLIYVSPETDRLGSLTNIAFIFFINLYSIYQLQLTNKEYSKGIRQQKEKIEKQHNELVKTQVQLVQSEKMASLGLLSAGLAHEINNPLNIIHASTYSLDNDLNDIVLLVEKYSTYISSNDKDLSEMRNFENDINYEHLISSIKEGIACIQEGSMRAAKIINRLDNFSSDDKSQMKLVDIHDGLESTLSLLKNKIPKEVKLTKDFDVSIGSIACDTGQLNKVYLNMIMNALDAMTGRGHLIITTKKTSDKAIISFTDDGDGIKKEDLSKIFDPFFSTKEPAKRTGLGLAISHGIIESHGGTIEVLSQAGKGTEFIISLPTEL